MEEARPNCFLPQQNTGYFVDYQAFAQVVWKQGSQRPLVECTGTFQALPLYNNTTPRVFEPWGASRIEHKLPPPLCDTQQEKPPAVEGEQF